MIRFKVRERDSVQFRVDSVVISGKDRIGELLDGSITEIDSDVASVGDYACRAKKSLVNVNLPNATKVGTYAFHTCTKMVSFSAPNLVTTGTYWLSESTSLSQIVLPKIKSLANASFSKCTSLKRADLRRAISIGTSAFNGCTKLETLILRNDEEQCGLMGTNALTGTKIASGTGYIYVPAALVEAYKAATNWATYAAQFRAIEDFPEIVGG